MIGSLCKHWCTDSYFQQVRNVHLEMCILKEHKSGNTARVHVFVGGIKVTTQSGCKYRTIGFGVGGMQQ